MFFVLSGITNPVVEKVRHSTSEFSNNGVVTSLSQVDIWSLGVLCFEFIAGRPPFENADQASTYRAIRRVSWRAGSVSELLVQLDIDSGVNGKERKALSQLIYEFPPDASAGARDLIKRLLVIEPRNRLALDQVSHYLWIF